MTVAAARRAVVVETYADYAVEAYNLRKVYRTRRGRQPAVDGLDLRVPLGGVHGFLGPNGSGKTTTIRMLLGLITADSGYIRVFDHEVPLHLDRVIDQVGAIVEQPKFFPSFSGRKNLTLLATAIGSPRRQVDRVLEGVGLADRAGDKFRTYSLGMKQRLAIAATLLKDPSLLIFDEPTNGLDPAGIHEIRATMRSLADRGKTVLVSSHILSEVQQVADTVSIIGRGRMLAEGRVSDILRAAGEQYARVSVDEPARATALLQAAGFVVEQPGTELHVATSRGALDPAEITRTLAERGLYVRELTTVQRDLESVFLRAHRRPAPWRQQGRPIVAAVAAGATEPGRRVSTSVMAKRDRQVSRPVHRGRGMLPLVRAETNRLLSRRFTVIALVIVLLAAGRLPALGQLLPSTGHGRGAGVEPGAVRGGPAVLGGERADLRQRRQPARLPLPRAAAQRVFLHPALRRGDPGVTAVDDLPGRPDRADGGRQLHRS